MQRLCVPVNKKALYVKEEHKQEYENRFKEKMNNEQMEEQSFMWRKAQIIEVKVIQLLRWLPDLEFVRTVGTGGPVKFFLTV